MPVSDPHPTQLQILDAARQLFGEDGYDSTSVAGIARQVGVVEGAVYRHFPSKRDLLHRVIASFYEPLIESASDAIADVASPVERVRVLIRRQLQAFTDDRLLCRLLISEARSFDDYYESDAAELSRRYTALFMDAFGDGIERGEFRADLPASVARDIVYGSIEHLAWSALSGHGELNVDVTTEQLMSVLTTGLTPPQSPAANACEALHTGSPDASPNGCLNSGSNANSTIDDVIDRLTTIADRLDFHTTSPLNPDEPA